MSTHPTDASSIHAQAQTLLATADELKAQAHAALQTTQQLLARMQSTKATTKAMAQAFSENVMVRLAASFSLSVLRERQLWFLGSFLYLGRRIL